MQQNRTRRAVVGFGPRGLGALEALADQLPEGEEPWSVDVFEPFAALGAGPNFDPDETPICLLNIPIRDIDIRPPDAGRCGPFSEWLDVAPDPDSFPTRADLGRYLQARLDDLRARDKLSLNHLAERIEDMRHSEDGWMLRGDSRWHGPYAEVLLTLGQPKVTPDEQIAEWQVHVQQSSGTLAEAYPAKRLEQQAANWSGKCVAIRGLALSAFDVFRALTTAQGGRFDEGRYIASGREPSLILPFSFEGHPPFPKPETLDLDDLFSPTTAETDCFKVAIEKAATANPDDARQQINAALAPVVTRIQAEQGTTESDEDVAQWLDTEWDDPGTQEDGTPLDVLTEGIAMATGSRKPTIGYTVGQVWRKWQDDLRRGYNSAETSPDTARVLVGFDEGLKRYSYGPPVTSSRELLALIEAKIVSLDTATDPDISLEDHGWTLKTDGQTEKVNVMIDAVMPSPDPSIIAASLVRSLLEGGRLAPLGEKLGIHTNADGTVVGADDHMSPGLCFLGRLSLGSVIAVDSLHDCFGEASHRWAEGVVKRKGPAKP